MKQYVFGLASAKINLHLFSHQNTNLSQVTMWFLTSTHIHIFLHFLIKKTPLKIGIQGNNLHIFLWHLNIWIWRKKLFRNLKILKLSMPKKWHLYFKQKIKPYFWNTYFLTIFNYKKAWCKQIYSFKF